MSLPLQSPFPTPGPNCCPTATLPPQAGRASVSIRAQFLTIKFFIPQFFFLWPKNIKIWYRSMVFQYDLNFILKMYFENRKKIN